MPHTTGAIMLSMISSNLSAKMLLEWVNSVLGEQYKKIEELRTGVAYCQLLNKIVPKYINKNRIKLDAKQELEYVHNMKLVANALTRLKEYRTVPIYLLIQGRFKDNYEFLKWLKYFIDSQPQNLAPTNRLMWPDYAMPSELWLELVNMSNANHNSGLVNKRF